MATKFVFNPIVGRFDEVLDYSDIFTAMTEPTGFVDKVATLSFVDATRVFTITGAHDIYINGVKSSKTTSSITIDDATGINWIYYNAAGVLSQSVSIPSFSLPLVATVYYNTVTDKGLLGEERHGIKMDCDTHTLLHYTVGVRYESGLTGTFADTTFSVSAGIIDDEDLAHSITPAKTTCNVLYKDGAADYKWLAGQTVYYYTSGGSLYYNNGNTLTALGANKYMAVWIFATNDTTTPIVSLIGQRSDDNLADARANNKYESLALGTLPFQEMKLLYRVILRNDVTPFEEAQDLRSISNLPAGTFLATQHNALTGLNWSAAGHTFDTDLNLGAYNLATTGTLSSGAITSTTSTAITNINLVSGGTGLPNLNLRDLDITIPNYSALGISPALVAGDIGRVGSAATAAGGMAFSSFTNTTEASTPLIFSGYHGDTTPTAAAIVFRGAKHNGATTAAVLAAGEMVAQFRNWTTNLLTIYGDGDADFQSGNITTTGNGAFGGFQLGTSTTAGYVLTADASGIGTWQSAGAGSQTPWGQNIDAAGFNLTGLGDGTNTVDLADGTYAVNATGNSLFTGDLTTTGTGTFGSTKQAIIGNDASYSFYGIDGTTTTTLNDGTYAINAVGQDTFNDGTEYIHFFPTLGYAGGMESVATFYGLGTSVDLGGGTYAIYANGAKAGYFTDGTQTASLIDGDGSNFNSGTGYTTRIGSATEGVYSTDGSNLVYLADGTYAVNAAGASYFEVGGTSHAIEAYQNNNAGGAAGYFHSIVGDVYLADVTTNYAINATGDMYVSGKITSIGGYDPPYVLYDPQTKQQVVDRMRREIPTEKASGMAQVYIPSDERIKWFQPSTGTFFGEKADKDGYMVKSAIETINDGKPCYNTNTKTIYSWDNIKGSVISHQATIYPKIPVPVNKTVNQNTGELEDKKKQ